MSPYLKVTADFLIYGQADVSLSTAKQWAFIFPIHVFFYTYDLCLL